MSRIGRALPLVGLTAVPLACQGQSAPSNTAFGALSSPMATSSAIPSAQPSAAARTCRGPEVDWSALPPVAQAYGRAWNEAAESEQFR